MLIEQLTVRQFRNLAGTEIRWGEGFNVIWGDNAQGKTNLLEAVYLLGHLKSFRGSRSADLIRTGCDAGRLCATVTSGGVGHQMELTFEAQGQTARLDGKNVQRLSRFLGILRPVLFTADELILLKGAPSGRRLMLDRAVLQTDPLYLEVVQGYNRILRQRNQLLREKAPREQLAPWSEALVKEGARIRHLRSSYLLELAPVLSGIGAEVTGDADLLALEYSAGGAVGDECERLREELKRLEERERWLGQTLAGPHRDDPEPLVNGRSLRQFGSQGQQRTFLLAFKAAQLIDLERRLGEAPPLLLDDLASELDARRQGSFFAFLRRRKGQVLITTTHPATLGEAVCPQARYFHVQQGSVTERQAV